ncbi:hypothetical protein SY88_18840 [Clostridiales bacterium PH28_bin88]|nr:hypothetical protein SY88_18840 [Clostridiales bacterium PH28_bin88]
MLEVTHLGKIIDQTTILDDVSFAIVPGTITGLIGRNGAGKTTLLRTMMGILLPDDGEVRYQGQNIHQHPAEKVHILFVPDAKDLLQNYSIQQITRLYSQVYPNFDHGVLGDWLRRFGLPLTKKVRYFSKGMKALFYLALAFAARTEAVLLDEPTEGLDPIYKKQCLQLIVQEVAERKPAVLISSHRLEELQAICDQVIFLKNGAVESVTDLMAVKERYRKLQVVYEEQMPESIIKRPNVHLLAQSGRIYTILIEDEVESTTAEIEASGPLLIDQLPLHLEDLFVSKLGGENLDH